MSLNPRSCSSGGVTLGRRGTSWWFLLGLIAAVALPQAGWGAKAWGAKVLHVKLLVDEEEATTPAVWQRRLAERLEAASEVLNRFADVRLVVSEFGTWQSDDRLQELSQSLREFEQEVPLGQARIAIGFSSQYRFQAGRNHLGGTRGPMRRHILIRENAPSVGEPERVEVLLHELGHFFCAGHSKDRRSAMRPVVGDGQARAASFQIGFDPINARIIRLVARDMRDRRVDRFEDLSPLTLAQLVPLYAQLQRELPEDTAAAQFLFAIQSLQPAAAPAVPKP